jgi:hypothetical protein
MGRIDYLQNWGITCEELYVFILSESGCTDQVEYDVSGASL